MSEFQQREFPMTDADFWSLSELAYKHTGIVLGEHKKNLVYGRLSRRLRRLKIANFKDYVQLLESGDAVEFDEFLNTVTTNLTSFFREGHHFAYLRETVLPLIQTQNPSKVRIWSAGCSTGEEPYSIAMTIRDYFNKPNSVKILATDLDRNVLQHARTGVYEASRVESLPAGIINNHFIVDKGMGNVTVNDKLKSMIVFNRLNLLGNWPITKKFDVIFCRNVLIYFDRETQQKLISRYVDQLNSKGFLFIGHSENISRENTDLEFIGQTIYRKKY